MKKIDNETIEKIVLLYNEYGVKKRVAEELKISVSTVSKYLKERSKNEEKKEEKKYTFDSNKIGSVEELFSRAATIHDFANLCLLSDEEKAEMKVMQSYI